jgi:hypothetical protein
LQHTARLEEENNVAIAIHQDIDHSLSGVLLASPGIYDTLHIHIHESLLSRLVLFE